MKKERMRRKFAVSFLTSVWQLRWPEPKTLALQQRHSQGENHCRERGWQLGDRVARKYSKCRRVLLSGPIPRPTLGSD